MGGYKIIASLHGVPEGQWWTNILPVDRIIHVAGKKRWSNVEIDTDACTVDKGLTGWSGPWKIGDKGIWGRGIWMDVSEWAHRVNIFVSLLINE